MSSDPMDDQATPRRYWPPDEHISGALAEALVAEHQHRIDPATIWHGPHTPLKDVSSDGMIIDAKSAWHRSGGVGCMGSGREIEARDGVTHYALVVLDVTTTAVRLIAPRQGKRGLDVQGHIEGVIYLVEAQVINEHAQAARRLDGGPGSGRNLFLPLEFVPDPIAV